MVYRIYVEKKPGFDGEAQSLRNELVSLLGIKELSGLRLLNRYDVEGIDEALFEQCVPTVFSEPPVDNTYAELPAADGCVSFAVEYLLHGSKADPPVCCKNMVAVDPFCSRIILTSCKPGCFYQSWILKDLTGISYCESLPIL